MTKFVAGPALPEGVTFVSETGHFAMEKRWRASDPDIVIPMALAAGWIVEEEPVPTFEEVCVWLDETGCIDWPFAEDERSDLIAAWDAGIAELREKAGSDHAGN